MARRGRILLGLFGAALLVAWTLYALSDGPLKRTRTSRPSLQSETWPSGPLPESEPAPVEALRWTLSGKVMDGSMAPIAGATVDTGRWGMPPDDPPDPVRTDDEGNFEIDIDALRTDEALSAYVQVRAAGYQPGFSGYHVLAGLAGQPVEAKCNVALLRGGAGVSGRVVDPSGQPVGGASVSLIVAGNRGTVGMAVTDRKGAFLLGGVWAPGTYAVTAHRDGYRETSSTPFEASPAARVDVGDIALSEGLVVEGHVRYADGAPVGGAQLWFPVQGLSYGVSTTTDGDGSFRVGALGPEHRRVVLSGWLSGDPPEASFEPPAKDVLLTVSGGRIRVRIVDENGESVTGATYLMFVGEDAERTSWSASQWIPAKAKGGEISYFAAPGTHVFFAAEANGRVPAEQAVDVPPARNEIDVTLRLLPVVTSARLRIELSAPAGTPFMARLLTRVGRRHVISLAHDGSGEPVFDAPPGSWHMVLQPQDPMTTFFDPVEMPVEIVPKKENVVRVDTPAGGRVRLTVKADPFFMAGFKGTLTREEDGAEIPLNLFAERQGSPPGATIDANRPLLVATLLRPGPYRVCIGLPSHEMYEASFRVEPFIVTDVVAEMVRSKE